MSGYSEDDIRRAAEIREWLVKQISDKQEELERLRATLSIIDSLLKQGSFRAAAAIVAEPKTQMAPARQSIAAVPPPARQASLEVGRDVRPLKRAKDELVLASAEVTPSAVTIVPAAGVSLNVNTPPFRSFFLSRILDGMKAKDAERVAQGALKDSETLNYSVEDAVGQITKIVVSNYRDKDRLNEIFNTCTWVFTRMLEKA